jgi:hypothetical protein
LKEKLFKLKVRLSHYASQETPRQASDWAVFHAALAHVEAFPIDFEFLKESKIGKIVKKIAGLELEGDPHDLKNRAQALMEKWKAQFLSGPPVMNGEEPSSSSTTLEPAAPVTKVETPKSPPKPPMSPAKPPMSPSKVSPQSPAKSPASPVKPLQSPPKPATVSPAQKPAPIPPKSPLHQQEPIPMDLDSSKDEEDELTKFISDTIDSSVSDLRDGFIGQEEGSSAVSLVTQENVEESGDSLS